MASTRKSAKRSSRKKGKSTKRAAARKRPARKAAARRRGKTARRSSRTGTLKRGAKRGLAVAREGIDTVRQAGERTWETLKSTTANVVEGVRDRLGEESGPGRSSP